MSGRLPHDTTTVDLKGKLPFPDPIAVLSLRNVQVFRAVDDDDEPILVVTDGVTTVAMESGLSGLSDGVVVSAERLSDAVRDYALSVKASWLAQQAKHR